MRNSKFQFLMSVLCCLLYSLATYSQTPNLVWTKKFGGAHNDYVHSSARDAASNNYSTGFFINTADLDPGTSVQNFTSAGVQDIYVTKLDNAGNFLWARAVGSTGYDIPYDIAVDPSGNSYITGEFAGTVDFDPGPGITSLTSKGGADIFVLKLDASGNFQWAYSAGDMMYDRGKSLAIDANGDVYITGEYNGMIDFDPGASSMILNSGGNHHAYILKLDRITGAPLWVYGGHSPVNGGYSQGWDIHVDKSNNIICGFASARGLDFGPGLFTVPTTPIDQSIIFKMDISGALIWHKNIPIGRSIAIDNSNNIYCAGPFQGSFNADPLGSAAGILTSTTGNHNSFVAKYSSTGLFNWAKVFNGSPNDAFDVDIDAADDVYVTGYFRAGSTDFDPGPGTNNIFSTDMNTYITKLTNSGNFIWARHLSGAWNNALDVDIDPSYNVFTSGYFGGNVDFDINAGTQIISSAWTDGFLHKMNQCVTIPAAPNNTTPTANLTICNNAATTLSVSVSAATTVNWYNSPTSTVVIGSGTSYTTPILTTGTYTYYAEAVNACGVSTTRTPITVTVTANASPTVTITNSNPSICLGQTSTLTASGGGTYNWSNGLGTNTSVSVSPSVTTTYSVTVTAANSCTALGSTTVTVLPKASVTPALSTICMAGQSVSLAASGGGTYIWSNGSTSSSILVNPTATTTYTVTVTNALGCTSTASSTVQLQPLNLSIQGITDFPCNKPGITLDLQSSIHGTYIWSTTPPSTTSSITVSAPGTYSLTVTNVLGCTATASANVTKNCCDTIIPVITSTRDTLCYNFSNTATLTISPPRASRVWTPYGQTTPSITVNTPGTYCVILTDSAGCKDTICKTIYGRDCDDTCIEIGLIGNDICDNYLTSTIWAVHNLRPGRTVKYNWSNGANTNPIMVTSTGRYYVTVCEYKLMLNGKDSLICCQVDSIDIGPCQDSCLSPPSCIMNGDLLHTVTGIGTMNSMPAFVVPNWYVSHSPSIGLILGSMIDLNSSSGIFTCYDFQVGKTYKICINGQQGSIGASPALSINAATGLTQAFAASAPIPSTVENITLTDLSTSSLAVSSFMYTPTNNFNQFWIHTNFPATSPSCQIDFVHIEEVTPASVAITASAPITAGVPITLTATGAPLGATYVWSNGMTGNPISVIPTCTAMNYDVTVHYNACPVPAGYGPIPNGGCPNVYHASISIQAPCDTPSCCGSWNPIELKDINAQVIDTVACNDRIMVKCGSPYALSFMYNCKDSCAKYQYTDVYDQNGIFQFSFTNGYSQQFNIPSTGSGTLVFKYRVYCGDTTKLCDSCTIYLDYNCDTANCCGDWESMDGTVYFKDGSFPMPISPRCNDTLDFDCDFHHSINFRFQYKCKDTCSALYKTIIVNPSGTVISTNWSNYVGINSSAFPTSGMWKVKTIVYCGDTMTACDSCTIFVRVKCDTPSCCGSFESIVIADINTGVGTNLNCGDSIPAQCDGKYKIGFSYKCKDNCSMKDSIFLYDQLNNIIVEKAGNEINPIQMPASGNGTYKINYKVYCGDMLCNSCDIFLNYYCCDTCVACADTCDWHLNGNMNVKSWNFIGSKNNEDFRVRTNDIERMQVSRAGNVGIGGNFTPVNTPTHPLHVDGKARVQILPVKQPMDAIVFAARQNNPSTEGELRELPMSNNQNHYLAGDGTWQPLPVSGGLSNADQGCTVDGNTVVLGDKCGKGGGAFQMDREINMNNFNLYFGAGGDKSDGKIYVGQNSCKPLESRIEISALGMSNSPVNDFISPNPSMSGLRFTDLTANDPPVANKSGKFNGVPGVLSLDQDGDVVWVEACCNSDGEMSKEQEEKIYSLGKENERLRTEVEILKEKFSLLEKTITALCESGCAGLEKKMEDAPILYQSIPNPTDNEALINYYLSEDKNAEIRIYMQEGKVIETFKLDPKKGKGYVKASLRNLANGTYLYTLIIEGKVIDTKKLQVLK